MADATADSPDAGQPPPGNPAAGPTVGHALLRLVSRPRKAPRIFPGKD